MSASSGPSIRPLDRPTWSGFLCSADRFPERPALMVEGREFSYRELGDRAMRIAATIQRHGDCPPQLAAVFGYRTAAAFSGVLGVLLSGNGYVPLNPTFPIERTRAMFERSECATLIVDARALAQLDALLDSMRQPIVVIAPDLDDARVLRDRWPRHRFIDAGTLELASSWREPPSSSPDAVSYLLFTSGSTGTPKGVAVAHRNVRAFLDYMVERYGITEHDRLSQMFDMTFDLSVFDMFMAWERGASVCCPSQKTLIKPDRFIIDQKLTVWFSVPSSVALLKNLGALKPDRFPGLRLSLFCGEPLPVSSVQSWAQAAPNSIIENLYGPTELTIACTLYRWDSQRSPAESEMSIVPIGAAYPGMKTLVVDGHLKEVPPGAEGELLMAGPQMSLGYWRDSAKTADAFVIPQGHREVYYRTGDRVRRPIGDAPLTHLGRVDFQVKVLGHRVELGEIEAVVRELVGADGVVAVGWPPRDGSYGGIHVFVETDQSPPADLRSAIAGRLPEYMVPKQIHCLSRLPRNPNGKFDRKAMTEMLAGGLG